MGDGTQENPYTREDVLRLIEENGGTAEGLDLSGKTFEEGMDLNGRNLSGIILKEAKFPTSFKREIIEGANLRGTHLENADLTKAHLERADLNDTHLEEANLRHAHLEGATLWDTHLERANLMSTHLQGANLMRTKFSPNINLQDVDWGNYILDEEKPVFFDSAVASYRHLKQWYTTAGMYGVAGKFFYREMEANRKLQSWKNNFKSKLWSWVMRILCGYGEKPERVVISAAVVIFGLAAAYYFWGSFSSSSFLDTLYYSAASFTALGYGQWAPQPTGWAKGMGAAEAIIGVFMMALLLVTFVRKWTR
jgi:hypothetical protein